MSVINTNITSMIGQQNLSKSQSALTTSMERLSSGLRINSAKDDAAGQAIANRMSSQITGLSQAQRNANDGISLAQTAEGSLNQVNDNLQRIRELSVQAQNSTNSTDDLTSIQNEIGQRLQEIDRISDETNFNGVEVLKTDGGLQIQVGANDGEVIKVNLETINSNTLGLQNFDVTKSVINSDNLSDAIADAGTVDEVVEATIEANGFTPTAGPADTLDGVFAKNDSSGDLVARAEDGQFYALERSEVTDKWTWDSSSPVVDASLVDTSEEITDLPIEIAGNIGTLNATGTAPEFDDGGTATTFEIAPDALFKRNDESGDSYAALGNDGKYYEVATTVTQVDPDDPDSWTYTVDVDYDNLVEVSESNVNTTAAAQITGDTETVAGSVNTYGNEINPAEVPSADALHEHSDSASGYAVLADDGNYYAATVDTDGAVSWSSDTAALNADNASDDAVDDVRTGGTVSVDLDGLADGETLHQVMNEEGEGTGEYVVKGSDANGNTTYNSAEIADDGVVTKSAEAVSVDPLQALDDALSKVDTLRSELGAVQNRFESAITNLQTNETNLSAARSRIEDADYATEVANMTRAQILQQAGTSVLAQANQIPQNVLSLLG